MLRPRSPVRSPGGEVGPRVHRVLAASEFDAADLDSELQRQLGVAQGRRAVDLGDPEAVVGGLRAAVQTPLGPMLDGLRLSGGARVARIPRMLREPLTPDDPLARYAERLADPVLRQNVRGYLTGSLDLVIRVRD